MHGRTIVLSRLRERRAGRRPGEGMPVMGASNGVAGAPPPLEYVGPSGMLNRTELVRLLQQGLYDLGYHRWVLSSGRPLSNPSHLSHRSFGRSRAALLPCRLPTRRTRSRCKILL